MALCWGCCQRSGDHRGALVLDLMIMIVIAKMLPKSRANEALSGTEWRNGGLRRRGAMIFPMVPDLPRSLALELMSSTSPHSTNLVIHQAGRRREPSRPLRKSR